MQPMFETLAKLINDPLQPNRGIKTDNSILLVYPPDKELDFRDQLLDGLVPMLEAKGNPFQLLDLTGFMFDGLGDSDIEALEEDEFDDYRWMLQGLSKRIELSVQRRLGQLAEQNPGGNIIVYSTVALYPLVRFGEVLRGLRDLNCRMILAFPGEERGGKLHFMNQPDGGNYLAVKLFWR